MEPDIENMTLSEYLEYEATKERQLWDDVRSRRSPTNDYETEFNSFHRNKRNTFYPYSHYLPTPPVQPYPKNYLVSTKVSNDVDIEKITIAEYNLYVAKQGLGMNPLRAENMKRIRHDIVQDSIWEEDDDSEEDQEEDDEIVQPLIPEPIHTIPPNDDYVAPATKSILDELLEEFRDEISNVTMVDDEADFNLTKDLEELERLLAKEPQSNFTEIQIGTFYLLEGCGARMLNKLQESIPSRSSRMLYWMLKLPEMVDVARRSRLGAWLSECCLFIFSSKSRGVFRSNSTSIFNFYFLNVQ
ncbi:hypothetical protein Tco_0115859 [Tanacetum coccineum]